MRKKSQMTLTVMIEIPEGSRNKYEFDKEKHLLKFDRMLFSAVHCPSDYGFILDSLAEDGDAFVLVWEPTFPGGIIEAKPVGLFKMWDQHGPDQKILCVPVSDPFWNHIESLSDVLPHLLKEIEHFFKIYKEPVKKKTGGKVGKIANRPCRPPSNLSTHAERTRRNAGRFDLPMNVPKCS